MMLELARHSLTLVWLPQWPLNIKLLEPRLVGVEVSVKVEVEEAMAWSKVGIS